jgi:phosphate acetyltransferase
MALKGGQVLTYADCGVVPYPDEAQLADIAIESARTHQLLTQEKPVVAMLSFSTKGSAKHERTELVTNALEMACKKAPDLQIDGEFQFDAAFVPEVAKRKAPESTVAGNANVFIFPNLDAGNIAYKITERLAGATATGPILQGLSKPMMDLSRGCRWQDIVNAACVAILMSE